jgi:ubiquinone/menaquinone biosynthesis C-methylase UbiE
MTDSSHRYDLLSRAYGVIADAAEHDAREAGLRLLDAQPGEWVLEIGCGTGRALAELSASVGGIGVACGLDSSAGILEAAREQVGTSSALVRGDARSVPCRDASLDAAFMSFTLELFASEEIPAVLAEIRRVLKPSGRLGVVSLNAEDTTSVEAYGWLHRHLPTWIDCRPIAVLAALARNGYSTTRTCRVEMWKLPVVVAVAEPAVAQA